MPGLSIILPVHNAQATLQRAVQSILQSQFQDFELLIHNDGSTDNTLSILKEFTDPRIRITSHPRQGLVPTLNTAFNQCRAPIIARMDADDRAAITRFQHQLNYLHQHPDIDAVGGQVRIVDPNGQPVPSWKRYQDWVNSNLDPDSINACRFIESPIVNPTSMARRNVFELGFRDGPWPEDYDFWLRAIAHGFRLAKLNEHVLDWTDHPQRYTRTDDRFSPEAFDRCRRRHLLEGPLKGIQTVDLWGAGQTGKPWLRWLLKEGFKVRKVIEVSRGKIGQTIANVPVVSPESMPPSDRTPLLIAVGAAGARDLIDAHLRPLNYLPGDSAWFVA